MAARKSTSERLLETADRLFYGQGMAIGVDTIAAKAGVSKRTLYNHYPSKDALITAYLQRRIRLIPTSDKPPGQQILDDFDRLERVFAGEGFRGCAFVNAVAELKDPRHAANQIALTFKEMRRQWFRGLLERAGGVADPEELSLQLLLLVDGAIAAALVRNDPTVARAARAAAAVLLAAAGIETEVRLSPRPTG